MAKRIAGSELSSPTTRTSDAAGPMLSQARMASHAAPYSRGARDEKNATISSNEHPYFTNADPIPYEQPTSSIWTGQASPLRSRSSSAAAEQ
jgi:hypothetical protein